LKQLAKKKKDSDLVILFYYLFIFFFCISVAGGFEGVGVFESRGGIVDAFLMRYRCE
jgi:hypothetical protein